LPGKTGKRSKADRVGNDTAYGKKNFRQGDQDEDSESGGEKTNPETGKGTAGSVARETPLPKEKRRSYLLQQYGTPPLMPGNRRGQNCGST